MNLLASKQNCVDIEQKQITSLDRLEKLVNDLFGLIRKSKHNWSTRNQLARLNDAALKDIGLTRADVYEELNKPLWK